MLLLLPTSSFPPAFLKSVMMLVYLLVFPFELEVPDQKCTSTHQKREHLPSLWHYLKHWIVLKGKWKHFRCCVLKGLFAEDEHMESREYSKHQEGIHAWLVKPKACLLGIVYSYPEEKPHLKHGFLRATKSSIWFSFFNLVSSKMGFILQTCSYHSLMWTETGLS